MEREKFEERESTAFQFSKERAHACYPLSFGGFDYYYIQNQFLGLLSAFGLRPVSAGVSFLLTPSRQGDVIFERLLKLRWTPTSFFFVKVLQKYTLFVSPAPNKYRFGVPLFLRDNDLSIAGGMAMAQYRHALLIFTGQVLAKPLGFCSKSL